MKEYTEASLGIAIKAMKEIEARLVWIRDRKDHIALANREILQFEEEIQKCKKTLEEL